LWRMSPMNSAASSVPPESASPPTASGALGCLSRKTERGRWRRSKIPGSEEFLNNARLGGHHTRRHRGQCARPRLGILVLAEPRLPPAARRRLLAEIRAPGLWCSTRRDPHASGPCECAARRRAFRGATGLYPCRSSERRHWQLRAPWHPSIVRQRVAGLLFRVLQAVLSLVRNLGAASSPRRCQRRLLPVAERTRHRPHLKQRMVALVGPPPARGRAPPTILRVCRRH